MSQTLYRKYRPGNFDEIIGQDHVVSVLRSAATAGTVGHAYLFAGSRGLGKTSIARILARELGISERDLYEIDAASNRGIDDIRALREEISTLPFESPYKMYIVDEVHMLTKEAFNALLKTLEEPPAHAKFVLATTELHKLPDTVISRCEVHHFKQPDLATLSAHMQNVAKSEGYELEAPAASLIALLGDGSYRDALGVLQKVLSNVEGEKVSVEDVENVTSAPRGALLLELTKALSEGESEKAMEVVVGAYQSGIDMELFTTMLLERLRAVLLLRHAPKVADTLASGLTEEEVEELKELAKEKGSYIHSRTLARFLSVPAQLKNVSNTSLPLELAVLDTITEK